MGCPGRENKPTKNWTRPKTIENHDFQMWRFWTLRRALQVKQEK